MIEQLPVNPCAICRKKETSRLCDFVVEYAWMSHHGNMTITCSLPMCHGCSTRRGTHDFCPQHAKMLPKLDLNDKVMRKRRNDHLVKNLRADPKRRT